jgi:hypothetical protein
MRKLLLICSALAMMFMFAGTSFADDATTVKGYVSDSQCGAKGKTNAECTKKCLAKGAKMVVVTDGDDKVLTIDNLTRSADMKGTTSR